MSTFKDEIDAAEAALAKAATHGRYREVETSDPRALIESLTEELAEARRAMSHIIAASKADHTE